MEPRNILILDDAIRDLRDIRWHVYESSRSAVVADKYLKKIRRKLRPLDYSAAAYPHYFFESGKDSGYRFCIAENHVAFFTFDDENVYIKRILHKRIQPDSRLQN